MELRIMNPEELRAAYGRDLVEAFPPAELKPLSVMERMREQGIYDPLGLFDGAGEPIGYILLWKHPDGRYILIDYLCVPAGRRNGGIGGKLLAMVRGRYPSDTVFIGETEAPTGDPAADALILRRMEFYRRNGAAFLGYDCALFGVHFCAATRRSTCGSLARSATAAISSSHWPPARPSGPCATGQRSRKNSRRFPTEKYFQKNFCEKEDFCPFRCILLLG